MDDDRQRRRPLSARYADRRSSFEQYQFMCQTLQNRKETKRRLRSMTSSPSPRPPAATSHRGEFSASTGSFDLEGYFGKGGEARVGINGAVRQPNWDRLDDPYNELLLHVNARTSALDVRRARSSSPASGPVPLCWEDELSVQGAKIILPTPRREKQKTTSVQQQRPVDQSDESKLLTADVNAVLKWEEATMKIILSCEKETNVLPPFDKWQFDVLMTDLSDERKTSRAYNSVSPTLKDGEFVMKFDLVQDLTWIPSRRWFSGRHISVKITGVRPWRFHLLKKTVILSKIREEPNQTDAAVASDMSKEEERDDERDLSIPTVLLESLGLAASPTEEAHVSASESRTSVDSIVETILKRRKEAKSKQEKEDAKKQDATMSVVAPAWKTKEDGKQAPKGMRGHKLTDLDRRRKFRSPVAVSIPSSSSLSSSISRRQTASVPLTNLEPFRNEKWTRRHADETNASPSPPLSSSSSSLVIYRILQARRQPTASVPSRRSFVDLDSISVRGKAISARSKRKK